jgi:hypothetical protein
VPGSTSTKAVTIKQVKKGCAHITRPNGSGAGLTALDDSQKIDKTVWCVDFARSSSGRSAGAPAVGGVGYVALATDAVTWAVRDTGATKTVPASYAPKILTTAQLKGIFSCKYTNWKQFNSPNAIFIYSVADWVAQKYHSPLPGKKATASQNQFGTDQVGFLGLGKIAGVSPLTTAKVPTINKAFKNTGFTRTIYDIFRYANTANHIPAYLNKFLGRTGYFCSNKTAKALLGNYGFLTAPTCGSIS